MMNMPETMTLAAGSAEILLPFGPWNEKTVFDVGCGDGKLVRWLAGQGAHATGIDRPEIIAKAVQTPATADERFIAGGGQSLPTADASLDAVLFFASLHHVPVDQIPRALDECRRVLKPGGLALILEPCPVMGAYYELTRLFEDEEELLETVQRALQGMGPDWRRSPSAYFYFERSFADFEAAIRAQTDDDGRAAAVLSRARPIFTRLTAGLHHPVIKSICRLDVYLRDGA